MFPVGGRIKSLKTREGGGEKIFELVGVTGFFGGGGGGTFAGGGQIPFTCHDLAQPRPE